MIYILLSVHKRLCAIKSIDSPFGGISVVVVGDFFQLRPVLGHYAFMCDHLWHLFKPFFLNENVRQAGDSAYAQLLNRARVGCLTHHDILLLKSRVINPLPNFAQQAIHVYPTLRQVHEQNAVMQSALDEQVSSIEAMQFFAFWYKAITTCKW